jgi:hypothetical protein
MRFGFSGIPRPITLTLHATANIAKVPELEHKAETRKGAEHAYDA